MENVKVGTRVSYEDMANPRQEGTVTKIETTEWGTEYTVALDDGGVTWSDLRQSGWNPVK